MKAVSDRSIDWMFRERIMGKVQGSRVEVEYHNHDE